MMSLPWLWEPRGAFFPTASQLWPDPTGHPRPARAPPGQGHRRITGGAWARASGSAPPPPSTSQEPFDQGQEWQGPETQGYERGDTHVSLHGDKIGTGPRPAARRQPPPGSAKQAPPWALLRKGMEAASQKTPRTGNRRPREGGSDKGPPVPAMLGETSPAE